LELSKEKTKTFSKTQKYCNFKATMPNNHNSKQRCEQCKSVLIKGTIIVITGETRVRCEKCLHVNVLAVVPQRVSKQAVDEFDTSIKKSQADRIEMAYMPSFQRVL
jgi:hypothetical protein